MTAQKLTALRRRVNRVRSPSITCPASRHLHIMADDLATHGKYHMLTEEPEYCAASMLSVLESLWSARAEIKWLKELNKL